ncbi:MAG: hypothetical protein PW735_11625 [Acidobacteriaceae bacterium]|nr:hypothetical protein [Acidobacteriaceae bacterium]
MASYIASLVRTRYYDPTPALRAELLRRIDASVAYHCAARRAYHQRDRTIMDEARSRALWAWRDAERYAEEIGVKIDARIAGTTMRAYAIGYAAGMSQTWVTIPGR